ncbi:hypothetical protein K458DRAFT_399035 [Lentithecium fluviatile CBS 122367]|uniref:mRNA export factor GLE1 n=1 Tax=Lentithecium fluviatile CBS 122367 TaxID=1168545 RepID=A0A6G1JKM4_9PLEO|nr:hypothetical protein K458DRAFT_399035 [Lentithecium fluviatile CBS 122367]
MATIGFRKRHHGPDRVWHCGLRVSTPQLRDWEPHYSVPPLQKLKFAHGGALELANSSRVPPNVWVRPVSPFPSRTWRLARDSGPARVLGGSGIVQTAGSGAAGSGRGRGRGSGSDRTAQVVPAPKCMVHHITSRERTVRIGWSYLPRLASELDATTPFLQHARLRVHGPPQFPKMPARSGASSSSMNTAASFSSSWLDGSPSRQSPNRQTPRKSPRPLKDLYESPIRQMTDEFNLMLSRSDRDFNERLDQAAAERQKLHEEQLAKAKQEHERVQEGAKLEIQRLILEQEQEQRRREEAQRQEIERLNREKARREAEIQQQRLEATRREEEAARQAAERQRQLQEADARVRAQKEQEEAARRQKAESDRKAHEAAAAAQQARSQQQPPPATAVSATPALSTTPATAPSAATPASPPGVEELHTKYLKLHARMKTFRKDFVNQHKQVGDPMKAPVGDTRRNMRKRLGQVTTERKDSQAAINRLRTECFDKALQMPGPTIDIRPFIVSHPIPQLANQADAQYPALLLYAWICFEKSLINQWNQEAANEDHTIIQELGLIAASLYSDPRYQWRGAVPLTDTLLAKLHRVCPMMFGINGNTTTKQGLIRLGLDKYGTADANQNSYLQMATGVGAGYAALSLRQFSGKNPAIPMAEYWRAVASICNTPSEALYPGHFMCLKGLLRDFAKKFVLFYGAPAKAVLRRATRSLPDRAPKERPGVKNAADIVRTMSDGWKLSNKIDIDR